MDGGRSADPEGRPLTYAWTLVGAPTGSSAQLTNPTLAQSVFVPDVIGVYQFRLVVDDGTLKSIPSEASVTVRRTNTAPLAAVRTPSVSALVGQVVTLDGSASHDDDRDMITYSWAMVSRPADSVSVLNGVSSAQPTFLPDRPGRYVLSLIVNDGRVNSSAVSVTVDAGVQNVRPIARAAEVPAVLVGSTVILNGADSSDPNNDNLRYNWSFAATPGGTTPSISGSSTVRPSFVPSAAGDYLVKLVVNDGSLDSEPLFIRVSAAAANQRPNAVIAARRDVTVGETVILDGANSTDPNRDILSYEWSVISRPTGSIGKLQGTDSSKATIELDKSGQYVVGLKVRDGALDSVVATHAINATTGNLPPVARVSTLSSSARVGSQVVLNGAASGDPDPGDLITYAWSIISRPVGSQAELDSTSSVVPRFVADRSGLYVVGLTVRDRALAQSALVTQVVEVSSVNGPPIARVASVSPTVVGSLTVLDGTASSDPDDDRINYEWQILARPQGSSPNLGLAAASSVRPTLTPDAEGDYLVQLIVSDGKVRSEPAIARVTATRPSVNRPPSAAAESSSSNVLVGSTVILDGGRSLDPEGSPLSYEWALVSRPQGSTAAVQGGAMPKVTLTADRAGQYVVGLRVKDGSLESNWSTIVITASNGNMPPRANPVALTPSVKVGQEVVLSGAQSVDPDAGDLITYAWTIVSQPLGSKAALDSPTSVAPRFKPDVAGIYVLSLTVFDSSRTPSAPASMVIQAGSNNVAPVARSATVAPVSVGALVVFDGSQSSDADEDRINYEWTILARPQGSSSALSLVAANTVRPTLTPDAEGDYLVQLVVSDGTARSEPVITRLTVTKQGVNRAPVAAIVPSGSAVSVGSTVILDGAGSLDPDGSPLSSYEWTVISRPADSKGLLQGANAPKATLTLDKAGQYVVGLKVRDGSLDSALATVVLTATNLNRPPLALVGALTPTKTLVGAEVVLTAADSNDPDTGDLLSYNWTMISRPPQSAATLDQSRSAVLRFTPDRPGYYVVGLTVNDTSLAQSNLVTVVIEVGASNMPPVARAASVRPVTIGTAAVLDGSLSFDVDAGDRLSYEWQILARPPGSGAVGSSAEVKLAGGNTVRPTLTPDVEGDFLVQLTVSDGRVRSEPVIVRVTGTRAGLNRAPIAWIMGSSPSVTPGSTVVLDASGSFDPEGGALSYSWVLVSQPLGAPTLQPLQGLSSSRATLQTDTLGTYVVGLRVRDVQGMESALVTYTVTVSAVPRPVAIIDGPQTSPNTRALTLDGSRSLSTAPLNYRWSIVSQPLGSTFSVVGGPSLDAPKLVVVPNGVGFWVFRLEVDQGTNAAGARINPSLPEIFVVEVR